MAKIIVLEFMTLDGVIEAPETWQFPYFSPDLVKLNSEQFEMIDAQLLGRVTYDIFADSWPQRTDNEYGIADKFNSMPKFVVSNTLKQAKWHNTTILSRDVIEDVRRLKQDFGGVIGVIGSAQLVQSLIQTDLIDEYRLQVYPVILGKGKRLFGNNVDKIGLRLVDTQVFSSGAILLIYQR
jgi:dihydrofolate reductase